MAQSTKFVIDANLSGIQLRTQASEMLTALSTLNSGNLEPVNPSANMLWLDTTKNILKIRDKTNTAWLDFASVNDKVIAAEADDSAKLGGAAASINEIANTIVKRTQEGDIKARYSLCEHVRLGANTQDSLMGTTSELIFRNAEDKYERAASLVRVLQCLNSIQNNVAWMDSDIIAPNNKNQVGYARLPGGLIIQFGMTHRLATGEARTQIFPIAFPHACFVVLCSPHLPLPDNGLLSPYTQAWSTTSCTVKNVDSDSSCHIAWIAIGN